jgi:hypothetical protein
MRIIAASRDAAPAILSHAAQMTHFGKLRKIISLHISAFPKM